MYSLTSMAFSLVLVLACHPTAGDATVSAEPPVAAHRERRLQLPEAATQALLQTDPQKRSRPCLCQFGVGLPTGVPGYNLGQVLERGNYGHHSYGEPGPNEKNGQIYTCAAGFVDTSHVRAGVDWTAQLAVTIDRASHEGGSRDYEPDGGGVRLVVRRAEHPLEREDVLRLAQRLAYERLLWHEVMSWYYHRPARAFSEQQSTFSPEDPTSNFLGTVVGRQAIELVESTGMGFEDAVDIALAGELTALGAVGAADDTRDDFALVDRNLDAALSGLAWYDSGILFWDERYLFKRHVDVIDGVKPWRLPEGSAVGCDDAIAGYVGHVPHTTVAGQRLTELYEWQFTPHPKYFEPGSDSAKDGHPAPVVVALPSLVTNRDLPAAVAIVVAQLREALGEGFDDPGAPTDAVVASKRE